MRKKEEIAKAMSKQMGVEVKAKMVVKLPAKEDVRSIGQIQGVYVARCNGFVVIAYDYGNKRIKVELHD